MSRRGTSTAALALLALAMPAWAADAVRGGRLWDTWWLESGAPRPTGTHPLASGSGLQGPESFRCSQCHGWSGSLLPGDDAAAFEHAVAAEHGFGGLGLTRADIADLRAYLTTESHIEASAWLDAAGRFTGNPTAGASLFRSGASGGLQCVTCHGPEGAWLNFGSPQHPAWIGTMADDDPARLLHRIRFGAPGSVMPGWARTGGDLQGAVDIATFAQQELPAVAAERMGGAPYVIIPPDDPAPDLPPPLQLSLARPLGQGPAAGEHALIAHVLPRDVNGDGLMDILACDVARHGVFLLQQGPAGVFTERPIGGEIPAPVHVDTADMDGDGDLDVIVSDMGVMLPSNALIGRVLVLEQVDEAFVPHVLIEGIRRVTDARAGDLDGDGDPDLAVAQFGYVQGEVRWMENRGHWDFQSHHLMDRSGAIHSPVVDLDGDGDLDIVVLFSQEWETVQGFINDGAGGFTPLVLHDVADPDFSSSGIDTGDIDGDGDIDIAWANGDAFVSVGYRPLPTHGVQWLENRGGHQFAFHRLGQFDGAYGPTIADLDGDGDMDIAAVSEFARWSEGSPPSLRWWAQDGEGRFAAGDLDTDPTHLVTLAAGDLNGDGRPDLVAGGMALYPPMDRVQRIVAWSNEGLGAAPPLAPASPALPAAVQTAADAAATPGARGMILQANGQTAAADAAYAEAEAAQPERGRWPYFRGLLDLDVGRSEEALQHFLRAATLAEDYVPLHLRLAALHFNRGDHSEAEHAWLRAGECDEAIIGRARIAAARGDWHQVETLLASTAAPTAAALRAEARAALGLEVEPPVAAFDMGLQPVDRWRDELLERSLTAEPLVNRAQIAVIRGRHAEAERWLRHAMRTAPEDTDAAVAMANLLLGPGRATKASIDEAFSLLDAAYRARPDDLEVRSRRAWAASLIGRGQEANAEWLAIIEAFPRHAPSLFHLGQMRAASGDHAGALTFFRRGVEVPRDSAFSASFEDPLRAHWLTQYAAAAKAEGQFAEAVAAYAAAADLLPSDPMAQFRYGNVLLGRKRYDEALPHLQFGAEHGEPSGRRHTAWGYALLQLGRLDEARRTLSTAVTIDPNLAIGWFHLAAALRAGGDPQAAIEALREAVRLRPDFTRARQTLEALEGAGQ
ncbi:MAG: FG-GAP-like repeat-containing protein [Phycisphaerales bacterium]|jgi:tetratricopeptide (TPR) repeat protein|nr:FG-GAP-like repeat-containing protein [Phycisphaerales bacterium]